MVIVTTKSSLIFVAIIATLAILELKRLRTCYDMHERMIDMAYLALIGSLLITGIVASLIPVDTLTSDPDQPDYHLVPYAGDAWGA